MHYIVKIVDNPDCIPNDIVQLEHSNHIHFASKMVMFDWYIDILEDNYLPFTNTYSSPHILRSLYCAVMVLPWVNRRYIWIRYMLSIAGVDQHDDHAA